jgi:sigma-B regulation protein RsbU (phosphoserine phosphatase)
MSMAKSALAVQVTFDPEVGAVMSTLNRMVYQSARRRLLSTLCYAILDPRLKELYYASAGHVFPYRVSPGGDVEALQDESYPLGVRAVVDVRVRASKLAPGDAVFMYSDGLVEATAENDDEAFGFERLEESLRRHAAKPPGALRDAVLEDVRRFTGQRPLDDDLTVLVLRLPAV